MSSKSELSFLLKNSEIFQKKVHPYSTQLKKQGLRSSENITLKLEKNSKPITAFKPILDELKTEYFQLQS